MRNPTINKLISCKKLVLKFIPSAIMFCRLVRLSCILLALIMISVVCSYPAGGHLPEIEVPPPKLINFMRRFGYLEPNPSDSEALYHEAAIRDAIKNIQKYGALNQTGKLDNTTLQLLSSPRCGVPDIESRSSTSARSRRYIIGSRSWQKRKLKYFIANWSAKMQRAQIEQDLEKAFNMWSRYNRLKFERVYDTSADIIVGFGSHYHGDNYPFDGPGNILAHAFYPYEMGSYGGDIHFDEDENWVENSTSLSEGVDFYSVALHELGHSLGLAHSPVYTSIMFPYYKGPGQNILDYDDVMAMYQLYVQRRLPGDEIFEDYATKATTSTTSKYEEVTDADSESPTTKKETLFTYEGDFESVSEHKRRYSTNMVWKTSDGTTKIPRKTRPIAPSSHICQGHFDAVSLIKGAVYIFKGRNVWKLTERYTIASDYPKPIHEMLPFLPENIQNIDAAYERFDGASVYFTGTNYWIYDGQELLENSPKHLSNLLLVGNITKIDAAMVWPKNNLTYIFAGSEFWKINERMRNSEDHNPKPMQRWVGIPHHINAAATLANGKTYFFKENLYWLYNNKFVRPERGYPRRASTAWLQCLPKEKTKLRNSNTTILFI